MLTSSPPHHIYINFFFPFNCGAISELTRAHFYEGELVLCVPDYSKKKRKKLVFSLSHSLSAILMFSFEKKSKSEARRGVAHVTHGLGRTSCTHVDQPTVRPTPHTGNTNEYAFWHLIDFCIWFWAARNLHTHTQRHEISSVVKDRTSRPSEIRISKF